MKQPKKELGLRIDVALHARVLKAAKRDNRSLNSEITHLLEFALNCQTLDRFAEALLAARKA